MVKKVKGKKLKFSPAKIYGLRTPVAGGVIVSFEIDADQAQEVAGLFIMHQWDVPVVLTVEEYGEGKR